MCTQIVAESSGMADDMSDNNDVSAERHDRGHCVEGEPRAAVIRGRRYATIVFGFVYTHTMHPR